MTSYCVHCSGPLTGHGFYTYCPACNTDIDWRRHVDRLIAAERFYQLSPRLADKANPTRKRF